MNTIYSESVQQQHDEYELLQDANNLLEEILGGSATHATAEWDLQKDENGRAVYWLTLKDFSVEVSGPFAPDELRSPNQMRFRLYRLWGDLLHEENRPRIERMMNRED